MTTIPGFFITTGWVSQEALYVVGLKIENFPIQSDQDTGRQWFRPGNDADILSTAYTQDLDKRRYSYGRAGWLWSLNVLSPKMTDYIFTTIFDSKYNAKVTVQTYNRSTGAWEIYNAMARFPNLREEAKPAAGGYHEFAIKFSRAVIAPVGPEISMSISTLVS